MILRQLQVTQLRAFEHAEFEFDPQFTLLVGINGVGKTTVLDALRFCLSKILTRFEVSRSRPIPITEDDIRIGASSMTIQLSFEHLKKEFDFLVHKQLNESIPNKTGDVRQQTIPTPDLETLTPPILSAKQFIDSEKHKPFGIYFSTRRSLVSDAVPSTGSASGDEGAAYAEALSSRELRLTEFALWMRVQEELAGERPVAKKHMAALRRAARSFLPECRNLHADTSMQRPRLLIEKAGSTLDARQLSDGERGLLALVLDLAKRLSQANPKLPDPVKQGEAVVLIDELDLHLHPKWQRTIVGCLTSTFPKCQFIATTHSPQIVAEVAPEKVLLISSSGVVHPDRTLGMDSNWILRHLMEAYDRPASSVNAIREVEMLIGRGAFVKARKAMATAKHAGLDLPEWSVFEARMARLEVISK